MFLKELLGLSKGFSRKDSQDFLTIDFLGILRLESQIFESLIFFKTIFERILRFLKSEKDFEDLKNLVHLF